MAEFQGLVKPMEHRCSENIVCLSSGYNYSTVIFAETKYAWVPLGTFQYQVRH